MMAVSPAAWQPRAPHAVRHPSVGRRAVIPKSELLHGLQQTLQSDLGIRAGGGFHVATALDFAVGSCRDKAGRSTVFKL